MESASRRSGPPPASSLAAPPEFYADENTVTRSVRNLLTRLGTCCTARPSCTAAARLPSGPATRTGERGGVDRELDLQLDCHRVNLPMLAGRGPLRTRRQTPAVTSSLPHR
jgi:hypothetical protein